MFAFNVKKNLLEKPAWLCQHHNPNLLRMTTTVLSLVALLLLSVHARLDPATLTPCEACALDGNCSTAYHDLPGQFCGSFQKRGLREMCCCGAQQACGKPADDLQCECTATLRDGAPPTPPESLFDIVVGSLLMMSEFLFLGCTMTLFLLYCCFDFPSRVQDCKRLWAYAVSAVGRCAAAIRLRFQYSRATTEAPSRRGSTANTLLVDDSVVGPACGYTNKGSAALGQRILGAHAATTLGGVS
ncbi:hypothetical protein SPRG_00192 [Saprolegnia parasitica CBS 223.65]|uniref:Uncharacterized protein n=1 Tax=Saprolegnia parasitica (strain CBS 223.65) TaxID=695850 RepID=A0A067CXX0_SAPPC|nr:hypothetical protein SPRG_00192 [Saprolegnia parasitica CBS 223.65]KDO35343.1 hypothetical protein SPRG_00192 [Saprolegnia parasitica CBS 223.65]|eukprot:XP_012193689.1 hypothetical protein SPRG_00192 [Saprolegnia parasitica CBS 223.65]